MKKKTVLQKLAAAGLAMALVAGTLTGCGGGSDSGSSDGGADAAQAEDSGEEAPAADAGSDSAADAGEASASAGDFTDYSAGFPEAVTLQVPVYERGWEGWNPTDNYWTKWIQENFGDKYNVNVEFVSIGRSTEVQDFTQLLSAGSAPTFIFHYDYPNILAYYAQDAYQELDANEIAYYAPTFWARMGDVISDYGVIDGKLMVVMGDRTELVSSNYGTLVRKDWMDALGISMPSNLEEYNDMLMKFKEAGYGFASAPLLAKSFNFDNAFRDLSDREGIALNSDLAVAAFSWEPTKEYLKNLNYQYQNGLIDPDFYLDTDGNQGKANFIAGKAATYGCYINAGTQEVIDSLLAQDPNAELAILDFGAFSPTGKGQGREYWPFGMIYGINADATDEERIAAWMYIEWMSQEDVINTLQNGFEGKNYELQDGVKVPTGYTGEEKLSNNDNGDYWCLVNANKQYDSEEEFRKAIIFVNAPAGYEYLIEDILKYNEKHEAGFDPDTCFTVPIESLSEYSSDLAELWKESYVQLVTRATTDEEFESMYEEMKQEYLDAGYQEILDEKKAAYDAGQYH
ncbi:MAG: extracellular solute-binding protein [Clostridium sp.]|nr:extracellular solute-binding protein [Clostridium sp.]